MSEKDSVLKDMVASLEPVTGFFSDYPIAVAAIVLLLSLIVAAIAVTIVTRIAGRLAERTRFHWDDQLIAALRRPVFWTLLLIGSRMAILPLHPSESLSKTMESAVTSILIILWSLFLLRFIRIVLRAIHS